MKQFEVAVEEAAEDGNQGAVEFEIRKGPEKDDEWQKVTAYLPQGGQLAMLLASVGRGQTEEQRIAGYINFFVNVLDDEGANLIERRLLSRKDPFGIKTVEKILDDLVLDWSGHPTQRQSDSASSPPTDGPKSTPPTLLST